MPDEAPYSYQDVLDAYTIAIGQDEAKFRPMDIPTFSRYMNQSLGTNKYKIGESGAIKRGMMEASLGLDDLLKPVSEPLGRAGESLGGLVGPTTARIGKSVGEGTPRAIADLAAVIGGFMVGGPPGAILAGTGALSTAAQTLEQTGSTPAAVVSGLTTLAAPAAGRYVGGKAVGYLTPKLEQYLGHRIPLLTERVTREVGEQAGIFGLGQASRQVGSLASGQGFAPITPESIGEQLAFNIPFLPLSIPRLAKGYKVASTKEGQIHAAPAGFKDLIPGRGETYYPREQEAQIAAGVAKSRAAGAAAAYGAKVGGAAPAFLPHHVTHGFGLIASEQLNTDKPYGIKWLPNQMLPGNTVLERMPKILPKFEWELLKQAGIEGLLKGRAVSKSELTDWITVNGPRVNVKEHSPLNASPALLEYYNLVHTWLDNLQGPDYSVFDDANGFSQQNKLDTSYLAHKGWDTEEINKAQRFSDLHKSTHQERMAYESSNATLWSGIASKPKPFVNKRGYFEIAVHLPSYSGDEYAPSMHGFPEDTLGHARGWYTNGRELKEWNPGKFGHLDDNEKVVLVDEIQSDWGQRLREQRDDPGAALGQGGVGYHPLTEDYNRLVLKALINKARKDGATKLIVADSDTAMLTEGHDRLLSVFGFKSLQEAEDMSPGSWIDSVHEDDGTYTIRGVEEPNDPQVKANLEGLQKMGYKVDYYTAGGMRFNYDEKLPKTLKELTGVEGEPVQLGEHKNVSRWTQGDFEEPQNMGPRDDLTIKNPDGTIKTMVSGRMFDLQKAYAELVKRGGWSLFGKDKISSNLTKIEAEGATPEAMARAVQEQSALVVRPGETVADAAARESGLDAVINQDVPPGQFLAATRNFFDRYLTLKGETGIRKEFLIQNSLMLAARFERLAGLTRLGEVLEGPSFYAPARGRGDFKFNALIGLRTKAVLKQQDLDHIRILWDSGHEMMHAIEALAQPYLADWTKAPPEIQEIGHWIKARNQAAQMSVSDKALTMQALVLHAIPDAKGAFDYKSDNLERIGAAYPDAENSEFLSDFGGIIAMGLASKDAVSSMRDYVFFNDKDTADLASITVRTMTQSLSAVKDYMAQQLKAGGRADPEVQRVLDNVQGVYDNLSKVLSSDADARVAYDTYRGTFERTMASAIDAPPVVSSKQVQAMYKLLGQPGVWIKPADIPPDVLKDADEQVLPSRTVGGVRAHFLERWLPMTQFAAMFRGTVPEYERATQVIRDVPSQASQRSFKMWQHWVDKNGKWDSKRIQKLGNMNTPIAQAFSKMALFQNAENKVWDKAQIDKFAKEHYPSLTADDIETLSVSFQQAKGVHGEAIDMLIRGTQGSLGNRAAMILMQHNPNLMPNVADRLGLEMTNLALSPNALPEEWAALKLRAGDDKAFDSTLAFLNKVKPAVQKSMGELQKYPGYFSEVRPGEWLIAWKDITGERGLEDFSSQAQAQARLNELRKNSKNYEYIRDYNKLDTAERWQGVNKNILNALIEADKVVYDEAIASMAAGGADAATLELIRQEFEPGDGALRIWTPPYMQKRVELEGREKLNMMEQMLNHVSAVAYGTARRHVREKVEIIQRHPNLKTNPAMSNSLRRYATEMLDASGSEWQPIKNFLFFNTLGFQLSTGLINATQNFLVGAPLLMRYGGTLGEAYRYMISASAELGQAYIRGKSVKDPKFTDEEMIEVMQGWEDERVIDKGTVSDYFALDDELAATRRSLTAGSGKIATAKSLMNNSAYHLLKLSRDFFMGYTEQFNQRAAAWAGYKFAKAKLGMTGGTEGTAYQWAKRFVQEGNFGGGRYNRPEIFNGLGKGFGAVGAMYALSGYTFNLLGVYARLAKDAVTRATPAAERASAGKALATALMGQALVGGAMGMPFASGLVAVIEQLFQDVEVKKNMREVFTSLGGGDTDMGHLMGDIGMSGVLTALTNTDVGSRFQLGTFMGIDPYNGFQLENFAGPTGALVENMIRATQQVGTGQYANAAEKVLPAGLRGLWRMAHQEGGVRNAKGQLIFEPTAAEQTVMAAGFKPKRLAHYYEKQALQQRSEEIEQRRLENLYSQMADSLMAGDRGAVAARLKQEQQDSVENGAYFDPREALQRVIAMVVARTTPVVQRETGGRLTNQVRRNQISALFPTDEQGSAVRSYMAMKEVERGVGLVPGMGRLDRGSLRMAQMVDQIRQQNPGLSWEQAELLVRKALQRQRPILTP